MPATSPSHFTSGELGDFLGIQIASTIERNNTTMRACRSFQSAPMGRKVHPANGHVTITVWQLLSWPNNALEDIWQRIKAAMRAPSRLPPSLAALNRTMHHRKESIW